MNNDAYTALDPALTALANGGPELASGLSNHGPMVAEALCALGHGDAVADWVEAYRPGMAPWPNPSAAINQVDLAARGDPIRASDWRQFFRNALRRGSWSCVLAQSLQWLESGTCADATHGVIRVGHAVRSLTLDDTTARRDELADALASWAATYASLGGAPDLDRAGLSPDEAVMRIPLLPLGLRTFRGTITSALEPLPTYRPFADVLNLVDADTSVSEIAEAFTRVYLTNAVDALTTIVFVHGVTSITAVGRLLPHLTEPAAARLLRFGWQSSAALFCAFGTQPPLAPSTTRTGAVDDLARAATAHGDEHVIKFTQACIEHYGLTGSPTFLAAAAHVRTMLPSIW